MNKKKCLITALLLVLAALVLWTVWGNVTVGVTHYSIPSKRLPAAFDGLKIAVISDLHNARFGSGNSRIIQLVEAESPDIIAITGDLVDSARTDLETAIALVHELMQIAPCYYVPGNHEARLGSLYDDLEEKLLAEEVRILHDQVLPLEKDGQQIQLAGLDDPLFSEGSTAVHPAVLETKLNQMNLSDAYCILLSHRPETFDVYAAAGIDLVLSGHAHGGQFRLPFIGGIAAPNQGLFPKYDAGRVSRDHTTMIVSRGLGNSIVPVRFNNRPEIVVIDLKCDEGL